MRRVFVSQNAPVEGGPTTEVRTPVAGRVSMIGAMSGGAVSTSYYFLRVTPSSGGSDILIYPPHDGVCVSVDVIEGQYVEINQVVGRIR